MSRNPLLDRLGVTLPVLAAPMAGGPTTPALVLAAAETGSLGFLAAGYQQPEAFADQVASVAAETDGYGVNLFAPHPVPVDPLAYAAYRDALRPLAEHFGVDLPESPVEDDDHWHAKIDVVVAAAPPLVSFTFGLPDPDSVTALHRAGVPARADGDHGGGGPRQPRRPASTSWWCRQRRPAATRAPSRPSARSPIGRCPTWWPRSVPPRRCPSSPPVASSAPSRWLPHWPRERSPSRSGRPCCWPRRPARRRPTGPPSSGARRPTPHSPGRSPGDPGAAYRTRSWRSTTPPRRSATPRSTTSPPRSAGRPQPEGTPSRSTSGPGAATARSPSGPRREILRELSAGA